MIDLDRTKLVTLRERLQARGREPSSVLRVAKPEIVEALAIVEEFGAMCEALYLMMAADKRVLNVEREVLRGALGVLSDNRVRTAHLESMLDGAARRVAEQGEEARLRAVIGTLADDPVRAEATVVLAAAIAAADGYVHPNEERLLDTLAEGLGLGRERANEILAELVEQTQPLEGG